MRFCYDIPADAVRVILLPGVLDLARQVAIARCNWALDNNLKNYGEDLLQSEQTANHIRAARTERAIERYTGLPWLHSIGVLGQPDVGDNIQVRSQAYPPGGGLAFRLGLDKQGRPLDKDDDAFVLVWDQGDDEFLLIGWLFGDELRERPATIHTGKNGKYKYVKPPYRPLPALLKAINHHRVDRARTTAIATTALVP